MKTTYPLFALGLILAFFCACKSADVVEKPLLLDPQVEFAWVGKQTAPAQITFMNQTKNATGFKWDFGNGTTSTQEIPHPVDYAHAGSYDIILVAQNGDRQQLKKQTIVISENDDPLAHFSFQFKDQRSFAPAVILLSNESVNATAYEWDINGRLSTERAPKNIVFNQAGVYRIKLIAFKNGVPSAAFEQIVNVGANPDPIAKFAMNYHPYPYVVGEEIQFVNLSENSDAWEWNFGANGPTNSNEQHPLVKFSKSGTHTITLVAKKGALKSAPRAINLLVNP